MTLVVVIICAALVFAACLQSWTFAALVAGWFAVAWFLSTGSYVMGENVMVLMLASGVVLGLYGLVRGVQGFVR